MQNFKISILEPCHEGWQNMTPQEQGRFCGACSKVVIDFTQMTEEEIIRFFQKHQNERVCGHLKNTQLEKVYKPQNLLEKHYVHIKNNYHSSWLRNGYLGILSSLLLLTGCQNEERVSDVETIKIEVKKDSNFRDKCIKDSTNIEEYTRLSGDIAINIPEDTLGGYTIIEPEELKGELVANTPEEFNLNQEKDSNHIFEVFEVTEDAQFEGGISNFRKILEQEIIYPEKPTRVDIEGTVYIQFVVNQKGGIEILKL